MTFWRRLSVVFSRGILIRFHGNRPYEKAVMSVFEQNYPGARVWVHHDQEGPRNDYSYNLICNEMKAKIKEGWFFFLDSDDTLIPGAWQVKR